MSECTHRFVQCNGCFFEERLPSNSFLAHANKPEGWVRVEKHDGSELWDLCPKCFKEVAALLFAKERIDRVLATTSAQGDAK